MLFEDIPSFGLSGLIYKPAFLNYDQQQHVVGLLRDVVRQAPLFSPTMPRTNQPMSVKMTSCGDWGWYSDVTGYRYIAKHPVTQQPWPPMPEILLKAWFELSGVEYPPDSCLINFYQSHAKMGLHQDRDEDELRAPVVSLSLGDDALFRVGGLKRNDKTQSLRLKSGDAFVLGGEGRLAYHGIDRVYAGTSGLLAEGGRLNITLRRVRKVS